MSMSMWEVQEGREAGKEGRREANPKDQKMKKNMNDETRKTGHLPNNNHPHRHRP